VDENENMDGNGNMDDNKNMADIGKDVRQGEVL
jgi:hypothetical protein